MDDKEFLEELERFNRLPSIPKPVASERLPTHVDVLDKGAQSAARRGDPPAAGPADGAAVSDGDRPEGRSRTFGVVLFLLVAIGAAIAGWVFHGRLLDILLR